MLPGAWTYKTMSPSVQCYVVNALPAHHHVGSSGQLVMLPCIVIEA